MNTLQYVVGEAKAGQPAVIRFFGRVTEETVSYTHLKPHAHGGASLTDTLLLYQVPHEMCIRDS